MTGGHHGFRFTSEKMCVLDKSRQQHFARLHYHIALCNRAVPLDSRDQAIFDRDGGGDELVADHYLFSAYSDHLELAVVLFLVFLIMFKCQSASFNE